MCIDSALFVGVPKGLGPIEIREICRFGHYRVDPCWGSTQVVTPGWLTSESAGRFVYRCGWLVVHVIDLEHLVVGMGFIGDINGYKIRPKFVLSYGQAL